MGLHDVTLDSKFIGFGSSFGPGHQTFIPDVQSGIESGRKKQWSQSRRRFTLTNNIDETDLQELFEFILCRRGSAHSFIVKDSTDFTTATDHISASDWEDVSIGTGDGVKTEFQLVKRYEIGGSFEIVRNLIRPLVGEVHVGYSGAEKTLGVDFTIDHQLGRVSFIAAPPAVDITAGCEFRVQVSFGKSVDDFLGISYDGFRDASYSIDVIEDAIATGSNERNVPYSDLINQGGGTNFTLPPLTTSLTSPFFITFEDGMFVEFNPSSALTVRLPDIDTTIGGTSMFDDGAVVAGGRYFVFVNTGTAAITVQQFTSSSWGNLAPAATVPTDTIREVFVDENGSWRMR